ncbi:hypothetical protein HK099_003160 [Clydaea vesicula]|uniref:Uncharacterized protein n=1 Tax=Clydaea vesicula TaxID=447962 RepID=A0AAD5XUD6_9FUNG|nr:hypothetical protein HK099_003160 [Clydaea vesicula]
MSTSTTEEDFSFSNLKSKFKDSLVLDSTNVVSNENGVKERKNSTSSSNSKTSVSNQILKESNDNNSLRNNAHHTEEKKKISTKKTSINQEMNQLYNLYISFCQFGLTKSQLEGSKSNSTLMSSQSFSKFSKDCSVLQKNVISTIDIDIIFNKVKVDKSKRKINFNEFLVAIGLLADLKFKDIEKNERFGRLITFVLDKGPVSKVNGIFDRLTDTSLYTGTHKLRFDENGNGLGLDGRDSGIDGNTLDRMVNRASSSKARARSLSQSRTNSTSPKKIFENQRSPSPIRNSMPSVFDRLTDTSTFKGTHKHRFNPDGTGRGRDGRVGDEGTKPLSSLIKR